MKQLKQLKKLSLALCLTGICSTISAQSPTPISTRDKAFYREATVPVTGGITSATYNLGYAIIGHSWKTENNNYNVQDHYRVLVADYSPAYNMYITNMHVTFDVLKKSTDNAKVDIYIVDGDVLSKNGQDLPAEDLAKDLYFYNRGAFVKTIDVTDNVNWKTIAFDISGDFFRTMPGRSFSLLFKPHPLDSHADDYTQLIDLRNPTYYRTFVVNDPTDPGGCPYNLAVQDFLMGTDGVTTTLNSVPEFCLGTAPWVIYANRTLYGDCMRLKNLIPLYYGKISMTIWECNYDLSRKYSTPSLEWEQHLDRGTDTYVDWFNLKSNLPPNGDIFHADGVYELWVWEPIAPTRAGKRYFHVWTDYGDITNVPAYSVNLRQNTINITNSTIKNNYLETCMVDLIAQNSINIVPGNTTSELLANTYFHIDPTVSCSNLQNQYRVEHPDGNGNLVIEEIKPELDNEKTEIYPNPTCGSFSLTVSNKDTKSIFVYDFMGKVVFKEESLSENILQVDITNQPAGIYLVKVISGDKTVLNKIVKK